MKCSGLSSKEGCSARPRERVRRPKGLWKCASGFAIIIWTIPHPTAPGSNPAVNPPPPPLDTPECTESDLGWEIVHHTTPEPPVGHAPSTRACNTHLHDHFICPSYPSSIPIPPFLQWQPCPLELLAEVPHDVDQEDPPSPRRRTRRRPTAMPSRA